MDAVTKFLDAYSETVQSIALKLREIVIEELPDAHEVVTSYKNISYSTDAGAMKGGIAYIAPFTESVNIGFMDGIDLSDPKGLLDGTGKRMRHIKIKSLDGITQLESDIRDLLQQANALRS